MVKDLPEARSSLSSPRRSASFLVDSKILLCSSTIFNDSVLGSNLSTITVLPGPLTPCSRRHFSDSRTFPPDMSLRLLFAWSSGNRFLMVCIKSPPVAVAKFWTSTVVGKFSLPFSTPLSDKENVLANLSFTVRLPVVLSRIRSSSLSKAFFCSDLWDDKKLGHGVELNRQYRLTLNLEERSIRLDWVLRKDLPHSPAVFLHMVRIQSRDSPIIYRENRVQGWGEKPLPVRDTYFIGKWWNNGKIIIQSLQIIWTSFI